MTRKETGNDRTTAFEGLYHHQQPDGPCIQIALQSAGIPSSIARAGNGGMDIMVPQMYCVDAQQLLIAEPHRGEILFTPGSACRILN